MSNENENVIQLYETRCEPFEAWAVAACIEPDGTESFWLLSPDEDATVGCACAECAPHEQGGPYVVPSSTSEEPTR